MRKHFFILTFIAFFVCASGYGQTKKLIREGNQLYEQKKYKEATNAYEKALSKDANNTAGQFNLGTSLYQQNKLDSSVAVLSNISKNAKDKGSKSMADYDIGNSLMQQQKWEDAIDAYKHTLINNPQDADAKYNLSYAEQMLKKQQQQQKNNKNQQNKNQQNKNNENKNDQNKKNQNQQNKDQQNKNNKDQQNKNNQNNDQQNKDQDKQQQDQNPQAQPSKLSQQQAKQLLDALQREEQKLQDKKNQQKGVPARLAKDW